jgi:cytochrome b subunit of formate dehydrogenase
VAETRARTQEPTATDPGLTSDPSNRARTIERNSRPTRWFHATVYLTTLGLLATGWWLALGREGEPSPLARALNSPDTDIHKYVGWGLTAIGVVGIVLGARAVRTFLTETFRYRRSDVRWFRAWPGAVFSGRFADHGGHFDPGQRVANVVLAGGLVVLVASGIGLVVVRGGQTFVWLLRVHRWSTYVLTPMVIGHVIVASGILPGYRGVWRAMHGRGGITDDIARRLWPTWTEGAGGADTEVPNGSGAGQESPQS